MAGPYRYQHGDKPLEGYTVLRGIGRGGFGEVYYAVSDGGREVALKAIQQNHDIELRGVRHCINLKSPHLISIFDVKPNAEDIPFVIMEYVAGPSLRELLPRGGKGLGPEKACFLLQEISKGLGYLHERGIVHRDLKPENIFLEDGYVKIGDYGLSKYISVSRQSGQTISVGTVHYMAPEIGSGNYHHGIDIYALGIIFYELLTGNVPFNGDSMGEILMKHLTCEPDVSVLDPPFRPIVTKALAKSPAERYQSVKDMVEDALRIEGLRERVARVDPQRLQSSCRGAAAEGAPPPQEGALAGAPTIPVTPAGPAGPAARADAPRPSPRAAPAAAPAPAPMHAPPPLPAGPVRAPGPAGRLLGERLVPGLATAAAMSLGLGLFTPGAKGAPSVIAYFAVIAAVTAGILWVEHWAAPQFRVSSGLVRRLVTLGLVGPIVAVGLGAFSIPTGMFETFRRSVPAILAGLLFVDWNARARADRAEQVSVGLAVSAGVFGLAAAAITDGSMPAAAGLLAAISLVINTVSPFIPLAERVPVKRKPGGGEEGKGPASPRGEGEGGGEARLASAPPAPAAFAAPAAPAASPAPAGRAAPAAARRLVRPRRDRVLAGVCAGIAAHYGWEVVWVRLVFVLVAVILGGLPLLAYPVLWLSMPAEPKPPVPELPAPPRPRGALAAAFWACLLSAGLVVALYLWPLSEVRVPGIGHGPRGGPGVLLLFLAAGLCAFVAIVRSARRAPAEPAASSPGPPAIPAPGGTGRPLARLFGLCAGAGLVAFAALSSPWGPRGFMDLPHLSFWEASLLALGGLAIVAAAGRRSYRVEPGAVPGQAGSGWTALGLALLAAAALAAAVDLVVVTGHLREVFGRGLDAMDRDAARFLEDRGPLWAALGAFSAGALCLAVGRWRGGAAHVARGLLGWAAVGALAGFPLLHAAELAEAPPSWSEVVGWGILLVACLRILTWPAAPRALPAAIEARATGTVAGTREQVA